MENQDNYKDLPLVSIITVTYNSGHTILDTLESVQSQDYPHIEHIIIDGLSTDDTMKKVASYAHISKAISEKDRGMYDALNKGIKAATGKYVGILNSDDTYTNTNVLTKVVQTLQEDNDIEAVIGELKFVSSHDNGKALRYCKSVDWTPEKFKKGIMPNHPTYYTLKANYDKYGYYKLDYKIAADFELMIRHLYHGKILYKYIPECLVNMLPGGLSNGSIRKRITNNKENIRACRENGISTNWLRMSSKVVGKLKEYIHTNG